MTNRTWAATDADGLRRLRHAGVRVITIANFSDTAGLTALFDDLVSTDANHTYKPDPRAYQLGVERLMLEKRDIVFAAFGGWDGRREVVWLSHGVGEPVQSATRRAGCASRSDRRRSEWAS